MAVVVTESLLLSQGGVGEGGMGQVRFSTVNPPLHLFGRDRTTMHGGLLLVREFPAGDVGSLLSLIPNRGVLGVGCGMIGKLVAVIPGCIFPQMASKHIEILSVAFRDVEQSQELISTIASVSLFTPIGYFLEYSRPVIYTSHPVPFMIENHCPCVGSTDRDQRRQASNCPVHHFVPI